MKLAMVGSLLIQLALTSLALGQNDAPPPSTREPDPSGASGLLARILPGSGSGKPAVEDSRPASVSKESREHAKRGRAFTEKNEYDKAIAEFSQAILLTPAQASLYQFRGQLLVAMKDYEKAIADDTEAIRLDPKDPFSYNARALAWELLLDTDRAIADFSEAIRLAPKHAETFFNRGRV